MENIAIILKLLNLYTHAAHNLAKGSLFLEDHAFLGELYPQYDTDYDDTIERMMGLGMPTDIKSITQKACAAFSASDLDVPENSAYYKRVLELEQALQQTIKAEYTKASIGTQQLIGEMANKSEARIYKLKQRTKK